MEVGYLNVTGEGVRKGKRGRTVGGPISETHLVSLISGKEVREPSKKENLSKESRSDPWLKNRKEEG